MYTYENVGFRPIDAADLETLRALHNDASTLLQRGTVDLVSEEEQAEWWKGLARKRDELRFALVALDADTVIGQLRIQNIDRGNRHAEVGLDIRPEHRGQGYGGRCYEMALEFLFLHYNMHMVYLRVGDFNEDARRLYERLGFSETGRYRDYLYRHGRYWDYVIMSMLEDDYRSGRGEPA